MLSKYFKKTSMLKQVEEKFTDDEYCIYYDCWRWIQLLYSILFIDNKLSKHEDDRKVLPVSRKLRIYFSES